MPYTDAVTLEKKEKVNTYVSIVKEPERFLMSRLLPLFSASSKLLISVRRVSSRQGFMRFSLPAEKVGVMTLQKKVENKKLKIKGYKLIQATVYLLRRFHFSSTVTETLLEKKGSADSKGRLLGKLVNSLDITSWAMSGSAQRTVRRLRKLKPKSFPLALISSSRFTSSRSFLID